MNLFRVNEHFDSTKRTKILKTVKIIFTIRKKMIICEIFMTVEFNERMILFMISKTSLDYLTQVRQAVQLRMSRGMVRHSLEPMGRLIVE